MRRDEAFHLKLLFEDAAAKRSQDLPPIFCPTGAIWWAKADVLRREQTFHIDGRMGWEMPWQRAVDIDTEEDWQLAELLMRDRRQADEKTIMTDRPALYTTVHPGVKKYLADWYASAQRQTDRGFDLWIGVDALDIREVNAAVGADLDAQWVLAAAGDSPAEIRRKAIARIVERHAVVIFTDSDDLLEPTRVAAALKALESSDVTACAMHLIDDGGQDLNSVFSPPPGADISDLLPRGNVFGLGNSAWRTAVLRRCLPIPAACRAVDWYLATRAWAMQVKLAFDMTCRVAYRLHAGSMAAIRPPFTAEQIRSATESVLNHYACVLGPSAALPDWCRAKLEPARKDAQAFEETVLRDADTIDRYVNALNRMPDNHVWWACVAHPALGAIWRKPAREPDLVNRPAQPAVAATKHEEPTCHGQ